MAAGLTLPLLAFQHHVGQLYIDPAEIQFVQELRQSDLAIVEKGRWRRSDGKVTSVVCKVWRPFVVATPQDFRELLLEASTLHRLQHPNLTRFLGLGCFAHGSLAEVRESMFMVEQYVGKRSLRKLISEQSRCRHKNLYDARTALRWAAQVASALATLHEQQPAYIHNDVKADNVLLTDTSRLSAAEAVLGDLKPHRHVYDQEPSTLSQHQQQQRLSCRSAAPSSLQQPRYTLERSSTCSSGDARRLSWSSATSSTAVPPSQPQQLLCGTSDTAAAAAAAAAQGEMLLPHQQAQQGWDLQQQRIGHDPPQLQKQPPQVQQPHASLADTACFAAADGGSWSSACSTSCTSLTAPAAAAAAAAAAVGAAAVDGAAGEIDGSFTHARSLPVPIGRRSSHASLRGGSSCPSNWNPGDLSSLHAGSDCDADASCASAAAAAVGGCSPSYFSATSECTFSSLGSASLNSNGSAAGIVDNWSCPSSAPADQHSLVTEIAAADAASAAAAVMACREAAAAADRAPHAGGSPSWGAVVRQHSGGRQCLSDSASSTGGRGSQGKGRLASLAADAEADDHACSAAAAGEQAELDDQAVYHEQQLLPLPAERKADRVPGVVRVGSGGFKGALATAFADIKLQDSQQPKQQGVVVLDACAAVDQAPLSPRQPRLLSKLVWRSKSSPLDGEASMQCVLQLARSAPDVLQGTEGDEEAVHHGAVLMPLQLSEPTGLCSLQEVSRSRPGADTAAALKVRALKKASGVGLLQQAQGQAPGLLKGAQQGNPSFPGSGSGGGSCVYYGWELLPSGAASPCGAVHSSMLDLFADVAGEDIVTSRRYRDSCQYTLVPGSFLQQKAPLSITVAGPRTITRSKSASSAWDPPAVHISSGSTQPTAAGSKWAISSTSSVPAIFQQQQASEQLEIAPSIGKGYAPSAIESKQHGGNSAFAALTAIECIAEEGSSIATDSCAPSRESTAHGGSQFFLGADCSPHAFNVSKDGQVQPSDRSPVQQQPSLQTLVSAGSLSKALSLSALLRQRSGHSSLATSNSGHLEADEGASANDSSSETSCSPAASPMQGSSVERLRCHIPHATSSPNKVQLLAVAASAGSEVLAGGLHDSPAHPSEADSVANVPVPESSPKHCALSADVAGHMAADESAAAAAVVAAAAPTKKVRFSLARPEGITASRDYSLLYAAPELVRGERPTEKVDVFAFGVMLYELLSRRLVASCVTDVCNRHSKRGNRHGRHHHQLYPRGGVPTDSTACGSGSGSDDGTTVEDNLPEHQLLLTYAQLVAGGYRPPMLPHFPEPVVQLISSCWAAEPHERPRMTEVLQEIQSWPKNRPLMSALNSYVLALADMGYAHRQQPSCGCSCVIS